MGNPYTRQGGFLYRDGDQQVSRKTHTPDSKVHDATTGRTWVLSAPGGSHVGPMNLAIRDGSRFVVIADEVSMGSEMTCWLMVMLTKFSDAKLGEQRLGNYLLWNI